MIAPCILLGSQNESIIPIVREIAEEMAITVQAEQKIEDFLLNIQENDYKAIIFDINMSHFEGVKTIRLIRRMRPKIPLITLVDRVDKKKGGQILSEGVFQLVLSPPSKENLSATLNMALNKARIPVLQIKSKNH